jgi:hypothetical protein
MIRSSRTQTTIITVILVGILVISGFTWTLYDKLQNQSRALETKNAEIETLNQRIKELSILEELANVSKPPDYSVSLYSSGVQIVSSYPMIFNYNYPDTYDDGRSIIVFYVPLNGSIASIDLFIDSISRYPPKLTLQRGNAWINQTWVKLGTTGQVYPNSTTAWEIWQAPVIWSMNVTESGLYNSPQVSSGWYTLSMFGPVSFRRIENQLYASAVLPHLIHTLHDVAKIDSYRVNITVTVLNDGVQGFFAASSDWFR